MRFQQVIGSLAALASFATAVDLTGYEYVVVGSGAGGGYMINHGTSSRRHF
jgi:choline dehydrogenase